MSRLHARYYTREPSVSSATYTDISPSVSKHSHLANGDNDGEGQEPEKQLLTFALSFHTMRRSKRCTKKRAPLTSKRSTGTSQQRSKLGTSNSLEDMDLWDDFLPGAASFQLMNRSRNKIKAPRRTNSDEMRSLRLKESPKKIDTQKMDRPIVDETIREEKSSRWQHTRPQTKDIPLEIRVVTRQPYKAGAWEAALKETRQRRKAKEALYYAKDSSSSDNDEFQAPESIVSYNTTTLPNGNVAHSEDPTPSTSSSDANDYIPAHVGKIDLRNVFRKKKVTRYHSAVSETTPTKHNVTSTTSIPIDDRKVHIFQSSKDAFMLGYSPFTSHSLTCSQQRSMPDAPPLTASSRRSTQRPISPYAPRPYRSSPNW